MGNLVKGINTLCSNSSFCGGFLRFFGYRLDLMHSNCTMLIIEN